MEGFMARSRVAGRVALLLGVVAVLCAGPRPAQGAEDTARLVELAKAEGEVHYQDAIVLPSTHEALAVAFRKRYGLPPSFKVTHTLRRTGEVVATATQEIKARKFTMDIVWVGVPPFFKAAAKQGDLLPYTSPEWRHYEPVMKRLGLEADAPHWITPTGYSFIPTWNRACPGFEKVSIESWRDLLNPAFKGKIIMGDIRKSGTQTDTHLGLMRVLGEDYFPKLGELQPVLILPTQEVTQKLITCEYGIAAWNLHGRVYQAHREDPKSQMVSANPKEGIVILGSHLAILKGAPHPNAAKLFVDFLLSEEGARVFAAGEGAFVFREGFKYPPEVAPYLPPMEQVKAVPMDWAKITPADRDRARENFRKAFRVD
jgi:iron(III) transport system substrate-binding protein